MDDRLSGPQRNNVSLFSKASYLAKHTTELGYNKAGSVVGTCTMMCPKPEIDKRKKVGLVDPLEKDGDRIVMIKKYERTNANDDYMNESDYLRTKKVLEATMLYMIRNISDKCKKRSNEKPSIPVLNVYLFMFDRVKEIQRDYIRQSYLDKFPDVSVIRVYEYIIRFLLLFNIYMCNEGCDYDDKGHGDELQKSFTDLLFMYSKLSRLGFKKCLCNSSEMYCYQLLFFLTTIIRNKQNLSRTFLEIQKMVMSLPAWHEDASYLQLALQGYHLFISKQYIVFLKYLYQLPPLARSLFLGVYPKLLTLAKEEAQYMKADSLQWKETLDIPEIEKYTNCDIILGCLSSIQIVTPLRLGVIQMKYVYREVMFPENEEGDGEYGNGDYDNGDYDGGNDYDNDYDGNDDYGNDYDENDYDENDYDENDYDGNDYENGDYDENDYNNQPYTSPLPPLVPTNPRPAPVSKPVETTRKNLKESSLFLGKYTITPSQKYGTQIDLKPIHLQPISIRQNKSCFQCKPLLDYYDFDGKNLNEEEPVPEPDVPSLSPPPITVTPSSPPPITSTPSSPPPITSTPSSLPPITITPPSPPPITSRQRQVFYTHAFNNTLLQGLTAITSSFQTHSNLLLGRLTTVCQHLNQCIDTLADQYTILELQNQKRKVQLYKYQQNIQSTFFNNTLYRLDLQLLSSPPKPSFNNSSLFYSSSNQIISLQSLLEQLHIPLLSYKMLIVNHDLPSQMDPLEFQSLSYLLSLFSSSLSNHYSHYEVFKRGTFQTSLSYPSSYYLSRLSIQGMKYSDIVPYINGTDFVVLSICIPSHIHSNYYYDYLSTQFQHDFQLLSLSSYSGPLLLYITYDQTKNSFSFDKFIFQKQLKEPLKCELFYYCFPSISSLQSQFETIIASKRFYTNYISIVDLYQLIEKYIDQCFEMIRQSSHSSILDLFYYLNCCYKQLFEVFNEPSYLHSLLLSYEFMNEHSISNQYLNIQLEFLQEIFPSLSYKNSESLKNSNTTEIGSFVDILKSHSLIQTHTQNNKELFEQYNQMLLDIYEKDYLQQKPFFESCIDLLYCNEQCKLQILQQIYPNEDHKILIKSPFQVDIPLYYSSERNIQQEQYLIESNKYDEILQDSKFQPKSYQSSSLFSKPNGTRSQQADTSSTAKRNCSTCDHVNQKREKSTSSTSPSFSHKKARLDIMKTLDEFKAEQEHHSTFSEFLKENCL